MPVLTPGEFDNFPLELQLEIQATRIQPFWDKKSRQFRKWKGALLNGDPTKDPRTYTLVGYGTGDPRAPHTSNYDAGGPATVTDPLLLDLGDISVPQISPRG